MTFEERKQQGLKYIKEDNYPEAFKVFSLLFYENPKDETLLQANQFLFSRITEGNYDLIPQSAEEYLYRGVARFYKQEFQGSIEDLDKAIQLNPKSDYAYKCKAFTLMTIEKYDLAIKELEKAISIKPHGEYYDDIADNYSRMGEMKKAVPFHEKAIEFARLWYNYGTHLGRMGLIASAVLKFQKAIELYPEYDDAKHNLNHYYIKLQNL